MSDLTITANVRMVDPALELVWDGKLELEYKQNTYISSSSVIPEDGSGDKMTRHNNKKNVIVQKKCWMSAG